MKDPETIFEKNYNTCLEQFKKISFKSIAPIIGGTVDAETIKIPLLGNPYFLSYRGITDSSGNKPPYDICVILSQYLLQCPDDNPKESEWISFRDFKDSGPLIHYFKNEIETAIASYFSGNGNGLKRAGQLLSGLRPALDVAYDLAIQFDLLPRIPVVLLFNDKDEEFKATCSLLFERRAQLYLDAECLAMLGWQLFNHLKKTDQKSAQIL